MGELLTQIEKNDPLRQEILERYKYSSEYYSDWNKIAKEDYKFALGDQWTQDERQDLNNQGRPCLTFNRIKSLINLIGGYERENSSRIKANPEGGEDRIFSEVMDRAIKYIDKQAHLNFKLGYNFDDGCYCGKGFLEAVLEYDKDPIRGELKFKQRTPYEILVDPDCREYDINEGARYCFKITRLSKAELLDLYPSKKKIIENLFKDGDDPTETVDGVVLQEGDADNYGNRPNKTTVVNKTDHVAESEFKEDAKFLVKEYWRIKYVSKFFVIEKESGEPQRFESDKEAQDFITKQGFGKAIERKVPQMHVSALCAGWILQEDELSPFEPVYSGFPFFRFMAEWAPNADTEELKVQGLVRALKDPQKEKNKAKSQNLHILSTQANSGWIGDTNALTDEGWKKLEQMGSKPGITIKKKTGSELREILPKGPNAGHLQREEKADEEFKQIIGFNPEFLWGMEGQNASGRAISMRVKNLVMSLVKIFTNYRYTKQAIGTFMLQIIPMIFDAKKLVRVLGPEYMRKAVDPNKYPDGLTEGHILAFLTLVKENKYDVYVSEADQNATIRFEIFQELTELMKAGAPIPMDLVIDYMDLPNSEEVKQKVLALQQQQAAAQSAKGAPGA